MEWPLRAVLSGLALLVHYVVCSQLLFAAQSEFGQFSTTLVALLLMATAVTLTVVVLELRLVWTTYQLAGDGVGEEDLET